jgi:hypothetical protein
MDEPFFIPCRYKGIDRQFTATFQAFGYTFRFHVDVDGTDVIFERDEEGNFRAIIPPESPKPPPDRNLLQEISAAIEQILAP